MIITQMIIIQIIIIMQIIIIIIQVFRISLLIVNNNNNNSIKIITIPNQTFHNNPDSILINHVIKHSHKTNSNYNLMNNHIITFIIIIITINNQATTIANPLPTSHKPLNYQQRNKNNFIFTKIYNSNKSNLSISIYLLWKMNKIAIL